MISSKEIVAHEVVTIRAARGGEHAPSVIPLPKTVVDAMKCEKGTKVHIYTDGERAISRNWKNPSYERRNEEGSNFYFS